MLQSHRDPGLPLSTGINRDLPGRDSEILNMFKITGLCRGPPRWSFLPGTAVQARVGAGICRVYAGVYRIDARVYRRVGTGVCRALPGCAGLYRVHAGVTPVSAVLAPC